MVVGFDQGLLLHRENPFLSRLDIVELEKHGMVKPFEIRSDPWEKRVVGRLKLDPQGRIIGSEFEWNE